MKYITVDRFDYADSDWQLPENPHSHDFCHIVFGLNRSGTTLVCKILQELKIDILHTEAQIAQGQNLPHDHRGIKYLELNDMDVFPAHYKIASDLGTPGAKGFKQLIPLSRNDISFLHAIPVKALICRRDFKAISASYTNHFGPGKAVSPEDLTTAFRSDWGKFACFAYDMLDVYFDELIDRPEKVVCEIAEFVGLTNPDHVQNAIGLVDPSKKHF